MISWPWIAGLGVLAVAEAVRRRASETIEVTRTEVPIPTWPRALDGFRVLVVSDLHVHPRTLGKGRREARLAALLETIDCDIVAVPGDSANTALAARTAAETLASAHPKFGIYFTLGNGEHKRPEQTNDIILTLQAAGSILINDAIRLTINDTHLYILGVDDSSEDRDRIDKTSRGIPDEAAKILLAHSPEIVTRMHRSEVDLVICGHTHGGQVCRPNGSPYWTQMQLGVRDALGAGLFTPAELSKFNTHGLKRTFMYVSRGVGTAKLPIRAFCRPEIALLTLRSLL